MGRKKKMRNEPCDMSYHHHYRVNQQNESQQLLSRLAIVYTLWPLSFAAYYDRPPPPTSQTHSHLIMHKVISNKMIFLSASRFAIFFMWIFIRTTIFRCRSSLSSPIATRVEFYSAGDNGRVRRTHSDWKCALRLFADGKAHSANTIWTLMSLWSDSIFIFRWKWIFEAASMPEDDCGLFL